jgi:hypothetical protein
MKTMICKHIRRSSLEDLPSDMSTTDCRQRHKLLANKVNRTKLNVRTFLFSFFRQYIVESMIRYIHFHRYEQPFCASCHLVLPNITYQQC